MNTDERYMCSHIPCCPPKHAVFAHHSQQSSHPNYKHTPVQDSRTFIEGYHAIKAAQTAGAMGNGDDGNGSTALRNNGLHLSVGLLVHARAGFVQQQDARLSEQGSAQAEQLGTDQSLVNAPKYMSSR